MNSIKKSTKLSIFIGIITVLAMFVYGKDLLHKDNKIIKIGLIAGVTGQFSPYGEMMKNGAILAVDEINKSRTSRKVELILQDNQSEVKSSILAYRNIGPEVQAFISGQSGVVLGLSPMVNNDRVVLLNVSALSPDIRNAGEYVFSNINDATVEVTAMTTFAKVHDISRVAILYQNDSAGTSAKNIFEKSFEEKGGRIILSEGFEGRASDVRSQLLKIKQLNPDAVYVPNFPENVGLILRQANDLGIKTMWLSVNMEDQKLINIAGELANGLVYTTTSLDIQSNDSKIRSFVKNFEERYGQTPTIYAATAYDGVMLLSEAVDNEGDDGVKIKSYLDNLKDWKGVSGVTSFDNDGSVEKQVTFKTIVNGKFVEFKNNP